MVWVPDKYKRKRQRSLALPDTPRPVHLNCTPPGQYYLTDLLRRSDEIKQQQQMAKSIQRAQKNPAVPGLIGFIYRQCYAPTSKRAV